MAGEQQIPAKSLLQYLHHRLTDLLVVQAIHKKMKQDHQIAYIPIGNIIHHVIDISSNVQYP